MPPIHNTVSEQKTVRKTHELVWAKDRLRSKTLPEKQNEMVSPQYNDTEENSTDITNRAMRVHLGSKHLRNSLMRQEDVVKASLVWKWRNQSTKGLDEVCPNHTLSGGRAVGSWLPTWLNNTFQIPNTVHKHLVLFLNTASPKVYGLERLHNTIYFYV